MAKNIISVKDLELRLTAAVEKAVKANPALSVDPAGVGYHPDPGILGFVVSDKTALGLNARELGATASVIAKEVGGLGKPATVIVDKKILMGYFPRDVVRFGR